jgi:hypothetical protein
MTYTYYTLSIAIFYAIRYIRSLDCKVREIIGTIQTRLYIFRVAKTHKLQIENGNLTQNAPLSTGYQSKRQNNLLKQFQRCIKDREPYPMVRLTCSEYGKLLGGKVRISRNRNLNSLFKVSGILGDM